MVYHMQFMEFLSLFRKWGLSYAIYEISFPSPKTWTIICNLRNFFPFSKNVDYHMLFLEFLSLLKNRGLSYAIMEFLSLLQKRGLSYAYSRISIFSQKTLTIICNFWNSFPFFKNMDYHIQFLEFLSLL